MAVNPGMRIDHGLYWLVPVTTSIPLRVSNKSVLFYRLILLKLYIVLIVIVISVQMVPHCSETNLQLCNHFACVDYCS